MSAITRAHAFKYPEGIKRGDRVVANARHAAAYRNTPKRRKGSVVVATASRDFVRILWDDCAHAHIVHRNFFDVVKDDRHEPKDRTAGSRAPRAARAKGGQKAAAGDRAGPAADVG